ncbi:hypothetical protein [Nocardiopsis sp. CA-288880]|uniref:hypothetical protein n=1 Tax=Nocardiopsis sp. CA-288880 TaxID=3239995 RepID=UPI003D96DB73
MTAERGAGGTGREPLERISFGYRRQGLLGTGIGPVGTSLSDSAEGYMRLVTWRDRLDGVVAPELPPEHTAPSYWYRRFQDGQGVLLRRLPEPAPSDRRGSRAQAVVGDDLNAPRALLVALEAVPELSAWLSEPWESERGWACTAPALVPGSFSDLPERLEREAAAQAGLAPLVARLLQAPGSPVDVVVPAGAPAPDERTRLLLLWGAYVILRDVLGTERKPRGGRSDWSFSTYEPWPERGTVPTRPKIAFRPPGPAAGAGSVTALDALSDGDPFHHDLARWLVGHLEAGTLPEATEGLQEDRASEHPRVLELLGGRMRRSSARPARRGTAPWGDPPRFSPRALEDALRPTGPTAPDASAGPAEPPERTAGAGRVPEELPGAARPGAPRAGAAERGGRPPEDQGVPGSPDPGEPDRGPRRGPPPSHRAGHRAPPLPRPSSRPEGAPDPVPGSSATGGPPVPPADRGRGPVPRPDADPAPGSVVPSLVRPGRPEPAATPADHVPEELLRLLDELGRTRDPDRISDLATRIVEHRHPGFGRRLVVRGAAAGGWEVRPELVAALIVQLLLVLIAVAVFTGG